MTVTQNLTEKKKQITELRERVKNIAPQHIYEDDFLIFKFLKARNFNLDASEAMLRKHIEWRKILQLDHILTDYQSPEVLQKYISQNVVGLDKKGNLVKYSAIGNMDGKGLFKSTNKNEVLRCCLQAIESDINTLKMNAKKTGEPMAQCIYIYDLDEMNLAKATDKASLDIMNIGIGIFQDNYPELLKNIYVINAMQYFAMVFPVLKLILARSIIGKMKVFGREGWKEELLQEIDADVLPAFLGGNRTDPDGDVRCHSFINFAGTVPREYYLTKNFETFAKSPEVNKQIIPSRTCFCAEVEVETSGCVLEYEFETRVYDIGFKVELCRDEKVTEIISFYKVETEYTPHKGLLRCEKSGTYNFTFDNSYSWFHAKELYFRINLQDPDRKPTIM